MKFQFTYTDWKLKLQVNYAGRKRKHFNEKDFAASTLPLS